MMKKWMRCMAGFLACLTFFVCTSSMAVFQFGSNNSDAAENGSSFGFGSNNSFDFGQFGSSCFGGFSTNTASNRKTGAFFERFNTTSIFSFYHKITEDAKPTKGVQNIVKDYKNYLKLEALIEQLVFEAAESAANELNSSFPQREPAFTCNYISPGWKYWAAILPIIETEEEFEKLLLVDTDIAAGNPAQVTFTIACSKMQKAAMDIAGEDGALYLKASSVYAYLLTVYNDRARSIRFKQQALPSSMKEEIVYPLESTIRIRKSWYASRDGGARKHTGTDIHADEGTEIYSCTDGTILYIGYAATPGYYVIVEDDLGYEYHYYHMVRMTDFLEAGQTVTAGELLGHVGNTGNSAVNHLHITIVAPDGRYVDPYSLMVAAKKRAN